MDSRGDSFGRAGARGSSEEITGKARSPRDGRLTAGR